MRFHTAIALLAVLLLAACNLSSGPEQVEPLVTATSFAGGKPTVTITSPANNSEVVINERALISATATDGAGVQRIQLLANGQIVKTVSSESPSGDTTMNVILDYTPRQEGTVNLQVVAYRGAVASDPASLSLVVRQRQAQVTATPLPAPSVPVIDPNDPTCRALTNIGLNLRVGPSTNYGVIRVLPAGIVVPIIGRLGQPQDEWWQVRYGTTFGWVSAPYTTQYGICTNTPVVVPPPTPTSAALPTSTAAPTLTPFPTATPFTINTPLPVLPDLIVSNINGPQTLSLNGQTEVTASYAITLTNTGSGGTGQFNNVVVKTPGNIEIPLGVVGSLDASESILLSVEIAFDAAGTYTLQVRSDSASNVAEISEVNNNALYTVTVS